MALKKPVLVVSPIPSHPQNQGNSARIYRLAKLFQLAGHPVHFVYLGLEGLTPEQAAAKRECWDRFYYVQPQGPTPAPSLREFYHVDDWYDERVSVLIEELCRQWDYAACLVNYVWCSRAFEAVPTHVPKIIDTHDVFGDRHLVAKAAGLEPTWFYTSKEMEAYGLNRADLIIAIQEEEEDYFRTLVPKRHVMTLGYLIPSHVLPSRQTASDQKKRVGYLGSGNPFNVESIRQFQVEVLKRPEILGRYEFHLAGSVCKALEVEGGVFKVWGFVEDPTDFYREMDVLINPMIGGTGLKIKSVEGLAYGRPLLATRDAMVGICPPNTPGVVDTPADMVVELASEKPAFISPNLAASYQATHLARMLENFGGLR